MKIGLVLEGGAMRGIYSAGVLDTFMDEGISFDGIMGVSAGALFGVNILSNQKGRVLRYNKKFNADPNYMGLRPLLSEGNIVNTEYAYVRVPRELDVFDDETFKNSNIPFYSVVTNVKTGKAEYILMKSIFDQMDTLRASGSMPFLSKPVRIGNEDYLDGAIADSIPFQKMLDMGYDKLVVVLTKWDGYVKKPMSKPLTNVFYRKKYPKLADAIIYRHEMYNAQMEALRKLESEGKIFVIQPSKYLKMGRIEKDSENIQNMYNLGTGDARNKMKALKSFLNKAQE
ncbi:MAG: patatin family protein [Firmicutes bacterium]|nr:patatin family protein [Bacillota bacterium]